MKKTKHKAKHSTMPGLRKADIAKRQKSIGQNLNFASAEAFKLLRTNLAFSMADEENCKIIGVTSSLPGEGKSTTSMNLAYTIAQSNKKVLLIEADMRRPTAASILQIDQKSGLSQVLAGLTDLKKSLYKSPLISSMWILPAGDVPPNPAELLASRKMEQVMEILAAVFEYIIVDLPPINAVSDGLAVSKLLSGMIMVVRQEYCDKGALAEAIRRMEIMQVKILGFVLTDAKTSEKNFKKYGKGYKYGYAYSDSSAESQKSKDFPSEENK